MAFSPASVVDVVAAETAPVIGTRHISLWSLPRSIRLDIVTLLAAVTEVEIQIAALCAVPLSVGTRLPLSRTRTRAALFLPLLIGLPVRIGQHCL